MTSARTPARTPVHLDETLEWLAARWDARARSQHDRGLEGEARAGWERIERELPETRVADRLRRERRED
jgi:hypothetical protein